jgi:Domain of unknown function (DUF4157)
MAVARDRVAREGGAVGGGDGDRAVPGKGTQIEQTYGRGAPLASGVRGELEGALGADLSQVRVHRDAGAAQRASYLSAAAYAEGQDIHLGASAPALDSSAGRHLLAHEVAHTVQQQGAATAVQCQSLVGARGGAAEQEAERFADAFASGAPAGGMVTAGLRPDAAIHCYGLPEHHDSATKDLEELGVFLHSPEGKAWAKKNHVDATDVLNRMKTDPAALGKKLKGTNGATFDFGDPTALMGDLFSTWEKVRAVSQKDHDALMKDPSDAEADRLTKGDYIKLAKNNANHYAGLNKKQWRVMHDEALKAAFAAKTDDDFETALFIEAAGAHFLTDGFASGHQFEKKVLLDDIKADLAANPMKTANPEMQSVMLLASQDEMAQMILKLIHDRMNAEGFDVENDKGMAWKTFGDGHLSESPETQHILALAVFESRQQVIGGRGKQVAPGDIDEIEKFFPNTKSMHRAQERARSYIPDARKSVETLMWKKRDMAPAEVAKKVKIPLLGPGLGQVLKSRVDSIADPGWENQVLDDRLAKDSIGQGDAPTFDGGFTIKRF